MRPSFPRVAAAPQGHSWPAPRQSAPAGRPLRGALDCAVALDLTLTATTARAHLPYLRRHVRAAHGLLAPPLAELSVALVGDGRMSDLHVEFMGVAGPTDVLTFPLEADAAGRVTAGEVVVCVPQARRGAAEHGVELRQELLLYAVHGLLHLCGYDDVTPAGFRRMHRREDQILGQLGVGPVFAPGAVGGRR